MLCSNREVNFKSRLLEKLWTLFFEVRKPIAPILDILRAASKAITSFTSSHFERNTGEFEKQLSLCKAA